MAQDGGKSREPESEIEREMKRAIIQVDRKRKAEGEIGEEDMAVNWIGTWELIDQWIGEVKEAMPADEGDGDYSDMPPLE